MTFAYVTIPLAAQTAKSKARGEISILWIAMAGAVRVGTLILDRKAEEGAV